MGEKTKELTLADLQKTIQDGFRRYEDRLEAIESKYSASNETEVESNVEEDDEDSQIETAPKGMDSFYNGYNPQTGVHDLIPKISKLVTKKIERLEQKREEKEYVKDRKAQENQAAQWLRGIKDHSDELEREVIRELKNSELGKMSPLKAVQQAYTNVTGIKLDKAGNPVIKEDSTKKVEEADAKPANNSQKDSTGSTLNAQSYAKLTDEELLDMERSGKMKENWSNIVGAQA